MRYYQIAKLEYGEFPFACQGKFAGEEKAGSGGTADADAAAGWDAAGGFRRPGGLFEGDVVSRLALLVDGGEVVVHPGELPDARIHGPAGRLVAG